MPWRCLWIGLCSSTLLLVGCNWFVPLAFVLPEPKRSVPAEYAHLSGAVTVAVYTPPELSYAYPQARLELAAHVAEHLQAQLDGITCVDPYKVEGYLARYPRGRTAEEIGRHFKTDFVVYLEVLDFGLRETATPDLVQGRVWTSVVVHQLRDAGVPVERFELDPIRIQVPDGPVRYTQAKIRAVRKLLYTTLADHVTRKFHSYEETIQ